LLDGFDDPYAQIFAVGFHACMITQPCFWVISYDVRCIGSLWISEKELDGDPKELDLWLN